MVLSPHLKMRTTILIVLVIFVFPVLEAQQRIANISLGSSLNITSNHSYWSSASGQFAFGFYQNGNGYAVGIWLQNILQKTVIWTANRNDTPVSADARLILTNNGRLILQPQQGQDILIAGASQPAASASMLDSGNFVLYNSELEIIWQSFWFPTDTIVSGQTLFEGSQLVSRLSETNHSSGKFKIVMRNNGNLVQYPANSPERPEYRYWRAATDNAAGNVTLKLDGSGWMYLQSSTQIERNLTNGWNTSGIAFYRATIDSDGIFRLYSHNLDQNGSWTVKWQSSENRCDPIGICDFNAYCFLDQESAPVCSCPPDFHFIDENQKNLGCRRNSNFPNCSNMNRASLAIHELKDVAFQDNPYSLSSISKDACWEACENDCNCEAALYMGGLCRKQRPPLRYGRTVIRENVEVATLIKVYNGESANSGGQKGKKALQTGIFIAGIVLLIFSCFLLAIFGYLVYKYRIWKYRKVSSMENDALLEDVTLRRYNYDELKRATNNFTNQIGKGAYGTVFRGVMPNGAKIVAIKRLEIVVAEGEREFFNEMKVIARTHHKNLVRLIGYCHDGSNRLLVYEYMNNGSLADFLFKSETKPNWQTRIEIALNVAQGILYLHEECSTQIIHCDIKPENILMDDAECAKIADFGLSKLLMPNQSHTYTGLRGTRGYLAPEWHRNFPITVKADVYSFGIMLFEIICYRRYVDMNVADEEVVLVKWVHDCFETNELKKLVRDEEVEMGKLERIIRVGLWCIQDDPLMRPSMKKVVLMMEGTIEIPDPPTPSFASISTL